MEFDHKKCGKTSIRYIYNVKLGSRKIPFRYSNSIIKIPCRVIDIQKFFNVGEDLFDKNKIII